MQPMREQTKEESEKARKKQSNITIQYNKNVYQKYLNLCHERWSYVCGMTWGWLMTDVTVINDRIFIFGWTVTLSNICLKLNYLNSLLICVLDPVRVSLISFVYLWTSQAEPACMASHLYALRGFAQKTRAGTSARSWCWNNSTTPFTTAVGCTSQSTVSLWSKIFLS